jgi:hypothetical protein
MNSNESRGEAIVEMYWASGRATHKDGTTPPDKRRVKVTEDVETREPRQME